MAGQFVNNIFDSKTIGNIKRLFVAECAVPIQIYVESAGVALLDAFIGYEKPDLKANYERLFGHSFIHDARYVAREMGLIGKGEGNGASRFFYSFTSISDLIPFYIFLIDLAAEGLFNWSSDVIAQSPCADPHNDQNGSGYAPFGATFDAGRWSTVDFWFDTGVHAPAGPCAVVLRPGENCILGASVTWEDVNSVEVSGDCRILVQDTGAVLDAATSVPNRHGGYDPVTVWAQYHHGSSATSNTLVEWQATCFNVLPDHEMFPKSGHCWCFKW